VGREGYSVAHSLARLDVNQEVSVAWADTYPVSVAVSVRKDFESSEISS
jgi:hypothetical protein